MNAVEHKRPVPLQRLSQISDRFDHVLLDQWGVLHDGQAVFPDAVQAMAALRRAGKRVLVLSNSGKRAAANARRLESLGLARGAYDGLVTSGEACWELLRRRDRAPFSGLGRRCLLATRGGDRSIVEGLGLCPVEDGRRADFILMAGLDSAAADPASWRSRLAEPARRGVRMICANPDLTMIEPEGLRPGPGRIARLYEELGGPVTYVGKPHAPIYEVCLAMLGDPDPGRVLAVGDSLDHDIQGGAGMGMPTVLVTSGVHGPDFAGAGAPADIVARAERLAGGPRELPDWLIASFRW